MSRGGWVLFSAILTLVTMVYAPFALTSLPRGWPAAAILNCWRRERSLRIRPRAVDNLSGAALVSDPQARMGS